MHKTFKEIREDDSAISRKAVVTQGRIVSARTTDQSRIKDPSFENKDKKRFQANIAGKQKEPNRGEGAARHPAVAHPHRTGPTNEAREAHTHKGHCQACGRIQAHETTGHIAKHGYTVDHGYFSGTCPGSGCKPLEHDHSITTQIQASLHHDAHLHLKSLAAAKAGDHDPMIHSHTEYKKNDKGEYEKDHYGRRVEHNVQKPYSQSEEPQKRQWHYKMESRAKKSTDHANMLESLKKKVHGQPLISRAKEPKPVHHAPVVDTHAGSVTGTYKNHTEKKEALNHLSRQFDKTVDKLQNHYLALPHHERTEAKTKVYYAPQFHHWKPEHSAAALKEFPAAKEHVDEIDRLTKSRKAVAAAEVAKKHVAEEVIQEKAEATRFHPTHKLVSDLTGHEIKIGSSTKNKEGVLHVVDKLEPSKFGGAADRVRTHSAGEPSLTGSFHPKDIGATMVKRTVKEGRESEYKANKELAVKKEKPKGTDAYHNWAASKNTKKKVNEDIGMAAGAAGDPGHVQNPNDNYAAQQRRKSFGMLRRQYKEQDKKRRDKVNAWHNRHEN